MEDEGNFDPDENETERHPAALLNNQQDAFLEHCANLPVGVLSVHVFGCMHVSLNGEALPEGFHVYGKISVDGLTKTTSVEVQPRRGKILWKEIFNFPISIVTQMKDVSNQVVFSVHGYEGESDNKHKLIGKVSFHVHKLVKRGWSMDKYELKNTKKMKTGVVELEFAFSYGVFGYGFSDQLVNIVHGPTEVLRQSMFPRVQPPENNKFSKWSLLNPQSVPHPTYIPFSERATDLMPELFRDDENTFVIKIPKTRQSLKDSMPRLAKLRNEYLAQSGRTQRITFLRNIVHAKGSYQGDEDSESSEEESSGYIPAGLAAMLSSVARSTITQTVPGVTVRSRADYGNLKVAVSLESLSDEDKPPENENNREVSSAERRTSSQDIVKRLAVLQETLTPRDAKRADAITTQTSLQDDDNQASEPGNARNEVCELQDKFKNLNPGDDDN